MIDSFKHKGLRQLFEGDNSKGVSAEHVRKLKQILAALQAADTIEAMRLPTFGLHPLKGDLKGFGQ
jgi:proteic killer suppression protein